MIRSLLALGAALPALALAAPTTLSHQGRALDPMGGPINGPQDVAVTLWSHPTATDAGARRHAEAFAAVPFADGYFSVVLGQDGANPVDDEWFDQDLWLGLSIGGGAELLPRMRLHGVPRAGVASRVVGGTVQVGPAPGATCPGDPGTLRWTGATLEVCTASGWVDALATTARYTDAEAVAAVAAADPYVRNTGDTVSGNLEVSGELRAGSLRHPNGYRAVRPGAYAIWRDGTTINYRAPDGVLYSLTVSNEAADVDSARIRYRANGAAEGVLYFNLSGGVGATCLLAHSEDDRIQGNYQVATDGGNDVAGIWGTSGVPTFMMRREGADGLPLVNNSAFEILCF